MLQHACFSLSLSFFFFFFCGGLSCCKKWTVGCVGFTACGSWTLEHWFNSCGIQALLLDGMWDLPGSGIKPISPVIAGGFFTLSQRGGLYQENPDNFHWVLGIVNFALLSAFYIKKVFLILFHNLCNLEIFSLF